MNIYRKGRKMAASTWAQAGAVISAKRRELYRFCYIKLNTRRHMYKQTDPLTHTHTHRQTIRRGEVDSEEDHRQSCPNKGR